jgi:hypothetical protein
MCLYSYPSRQFRRKAGDVTGCAAPGPVQSLHAQSVLRRLVRTPSARRPSQEYETTARSCFASLWPCDVIIVRSLHEVYTADAFIVFPRVCPQSSSVFARVRPVHCSSESNQRFLPSSAVRYQTYDMPWKCTDCTA